MRTHFFVEFLEIHQAARTSVHLYFPHSLEHDLFKPAWLSKSLWTVWAVALSCRKTIVCFGRCLPGFWEYFTVLPAAATGRAVVKSSSEVSMSHISKHWPTVVWLYDRTDCVIKMCFSLARTAQYHFLSLCQYFILIWSLQVQRSALLARTCKNI